MAKLFFQTLLVLLLLGANAVSGHAAMIELTWNATYTAVSSYESIFANYFDVGDQFELHVVYNDENTTRNVWQDGTNDIAEFGGGDDWTTGPMNPYGAYLAYSNAVFTMTSDNWDTYLNDPNHFPDTQNWSYMASLNEAYGYEKRYNMQADGVRILARDNTDPWSFRILESHYLESGMVSGVDAGIFEINSFSSSSLDQQPVPEPSTMFLLGAGLAGLVFYRRRTQC